MQTFTLLSTLVAAVSAAVIPASVNTRASNDPNVFKLKHATLGYVEWDGTLNGNLGWFGNSTTEKDMTSFIQFNANEGIAFYSQDTALEIYLRPTHGTPAYFVKVGNPEQDAAPALTLSSNFTITDGDLFGYNGASNVWSSCGTGTDATLYFGTVTEPSAGCSENFELEVEYTASS